MRAHAHGQVGNTEPPAFLIFQFAMNDFDLWKSFMDWLNTLGTAANPIEVFTDTEDEEEVEVIDLTDSPPRRGPELRSAAAPCPPGGRFSI